MPGSPPAVPALPDSVAALRRHVALARTEPERKALFAAIRAEYWRGQPREPSRTTPAARARFEQQLLEFVRRPATGRRNGELSWAHRDAWVELGELRSPGFARVLRRCVRSSNRSLRAEAAEHLAWLAFDTDIPLLDRLARSSNGAVAARVFYGASMAADYGRASPRFRRRIGDAAEPVVTGTRTAGSGGRARALAIDAATALRSLDPRRALALMRSTRCLHISNPALCIVLLKLLEERGERLALHPPEPAILWALFDQALKRRRGRVTDQILGTALILAAETDPIRARREAERIKRSRRPGDPLHRDALAALRRCADVPDPLDAWSLLDRAGARAHPFPPRAVDVLRAFELTQCVLADSLEWYLDNGGERWARARAGMLVLGQRAAAKALTRAVRSIAPDAEKLDGTALERALRAPSSAAKRAFARRADEYERLNEQVINAVERFMTDQPQLFSRGPVSQKGRKKPHA